MRDKKVDSVVDLYGLTGEPLFKQPVLVFGNSTTEIIEGYDFGAWQRKYKKGDKLIDAGGTVWAHDGDGGWQALDGRFNKAKEASEQ